MTAGLTSFNPLPSPKQGETRCCALLIRFHTMRSFNPLPSPKQGETGFQDVRRPQGPDTCFNPLPSPKQGETSRSCTYGGDCRNVSIRSPHRSKGRHLRFGFPVPSTSFNPLPSPKQGETFPVGWGHAAYPRSFNPLPSPKQGETYRRSPMRRVPSFNPLPSPKQGETREMYDQRRFLSFNPLPSPKQGETAVRLLAQLCFNPLPSPKQGETAICDRLPTIYRWMFQSAPLTEARGDHRSRSLRRSATRMFQSAPLTEARGDALDEAAMLGRLQSFNPLPSPKQGETLVAITSGITKTYTGKCAIRSDSCQECPTRLPRNAITCCYAGSFQLRESKCKTPSLHFRARYKTSGSFKSTGSPTP